MLGLKALPSAAESLICDFLPGSFVSRPRIRPKGKRWLVCASAKEDERTSSLSLVESVSFSSSTERECCPGASLFVRRDSSFEVEAGRSKAKKGGNSGGKIERRPPPPSRIPRRRRSSGRDDKPRSEDDMPFLRDYGDEAPDTRPKTKLVGGWGRDKSMQREVPVVKNAPHAEEEGAKKEVRKRPSGKLPPVPIDDYSVRYPDEDYLDGPFGPYAWRGVPIGEPIEGTLSNTEVVFFSNEDCEDDDDRYREDLQRYNYTVEYTNKHTKLDRDIGVHYYFVFARDRFSTVQEPWRDWTLVAQLATESSEELEQRVLFSRLTPTVKDILGKCVGWFRPDLVYVRKPMFQLRLEVQTKFITGLVDLLKVPATTESYYGKLCQMLRVSTTSSSVDVKAAYDALEEEKKLRCIGYLLTEHPFKLLPSLKYERSTRGIGDANEVEGRVFMPEQPREEAEGERAVEGNDQDDRESDQPRRWGKYEPEPGLYVKTLIRPFNYSNLVEEIATYHNALHGSDSAFEYIREAVNSR